MTTDINELVAKLREAIRVSPHTRMPQNLRKECADALEAMAGEVERLKGDLRKAGFHSVMQGHQDVTEIFAQAERAQAAEAERDRLKELYDAGCKQWNPVFKVVLDERNRLKAALETIRQIVRMGPDHVTDDDISEVSATARKALGGDA